MSLQTRRPASGSAPVFAAFICPLCKTAEHMAPSQWGHPGVPLCHNPPCIYKRTMKASRVDTPIASVPVRLSPVLKGAPVSIEPTSGGDSIPIGSLLKAGGKTNRKLILFLLDGKPRTAQECITAAGFSTMETFRTARARLRERGLVIRRTQTDHKPASYQLVLTPKGSPA
jgi:hypothetical protein